MKKKIPFLTIQDEDGNIIDEVLMTAADDDWIRAGRLRIKAREGDKEAAAELSRMDNTYMVEFEDDESET